MRTHFLFVLLALSFTTTLPAQAQTAAAPPPVVTPISETPLPDYPGKEVLMLTVEFPPGGADPIHRHDAHGFVYVLEGSIIMGVKGGKEVTLLPGQTFHEGPNDIHTVGRNASQDKPAKFVVFLLKDQNKPAVIPVN
ncbi:cupin domain-containing protein [Pseudomonas sp. PD9R]|uniref:cupin domain-containing protein n=1 Tax=Pseudomonas sp. PD9R TaxID=2853534 RepID=UPI001C43FD87|nr:cupin domain-containing protein [Pseudomonas sp. PD9R]MBV6826343.1 cupin domain-containing protein [Pseudomonas sp. PD9R]